MDNQKANSLRIKRKSEIIIGKNLINPNYKIVEISKTKKKISEI